MTQAAMIVTPLRFVGGVIGLWTAVRLMVLLPHTATPALIPAANADTYVAPAAMRSARPRAGPALVRGGDAGGAPLASLKVPAVSASASSEAAGSRLLAATSLDQTAGPRQSEPVDGSGVALSPSGLIALVPPRAPGASRWSGNIYLFRRGDDGSTPLASGGQLGGSQGGARVAYRLDMAGRIAAAARIASPLADAHGAEAAVGIDWHPLPTVPLRVSVERRIDLGGGGRNAWSAYAAGGFWRQAGRITLDGYAQAGIVGARRRDIFADGALRAGYRRELGTGGSLTFGAGAWAAAQPHVERVDLGPRIALGLNIGGTPLTVAAEWRVRVAGDAAPGSGLALTLAADF